MPRQSRIDAPGALHRFRQKINEAESTEDVKKFFIYTVKELLESILPEKFGFGYEDADRR